MRTPTRSYRGAGGLLLGVLLGCTGSIDAPADVDRTRAGRSGDGPTDADPAATAGASAGDGPAGRAGSGSEDGVPGQEPLDCDATPIDPGPAPLRLLTRAQYLSTVRDLFGDVAGLDAALGPATEASAFGLLQADVTQVELEGFQNAADLIAAHVVQDQGRLDAIAPCASGTDPNDCARAMLERFGARIYRAPIDDPADVARHLALFQAGAQTSYAHGIEMLLRGLLQAPRFLYRVELGTSEQVSENAVKLSGHEVAARLSYLVWGTLPDEALAQAAADGALDTPAGVADQLVHMLEDPRGAALLRRFLSSWVHVSALDSAVKDPEMFPAWESPDLRAALRDQASRFFDHVLQDEGGTLTALLTSRTVFANAALADYYGAGAGSDFEPLELAADRASGLLTLPALLARLAKPDESSPIYRGKFVREALLCQQLPSPPANVPKPPEVDPNVSTRERLRQHEVDPACSNCHQLLDPIGFGFEHFDAIGRYRDSDGGDPVDAHGALVATRDSDGEFDGVGALGARLAQSGEVEECIARQWFRFAIDRFEQDADACSMQRLLELFRAAGQDLNALPGAVVATDAFLYRRPAGMEPSP